MEHNCPHCGKPINPAKMLGSISTPKKIEAGKKRGELLRRMWANAKKVQAQIEAPNSGTVAFSGGSVVNTMTGEQREIPSTAVFFDIPTKPATLEGKKAAAMAALANRGNPFDITDLGQPGSCKINVPDLNEVPRAPFDLNLEGEPHRVTQMGKRLGLFYVGGGEPVFARYLEAGELEKYWEERIK